MAEPTYTLNEAREELARRQCAAGGHDFETVLNGCGEPVQMFCSNACGRGPWNICPSDSGPSGG